MNAELFRAGFPAELVSTLPCTNYGGAVLPTEVRISHVFLPSCRRGDILDIEAMCQVTNDLGYNVEFTTRLLLARSATSLDGQRITYPKTGMGENVTPDTHHMIRNMTGRVIIEADGDYYVALIGYAGSDAAKPGHAIQIDRGGQISVLRFR